jgi:hypothetical protein
VPAGAKSRLPPPGPGRAAAHRGQAERGLAVPPAPGPARPGRATARRGHVELPLAAPPAGAGQVGRAGAPAA